QLARTFPDRVRRRNIAKHQIPPHLLRIDLSCARPAGHGIQREKIGSEADAINRALPHQRLHPVAVARKNELFASRIDPAERKHAAQTSERIESPASERLKQYFGVASRSEADAVLFELASKLLEVINLAVENNPPPPRILHWLSSPFG